MHSDDCEEHEMHGDTGCSRTPRSMWSLSAGLLAVVAGTTLLTAACGGSANSPQVASLGASSGAASGAATGSGHGNGHSPAAGSSVANRPNGSATQLLNEWAVCMRRHGDPGQADPTIDASKVIHVIMLPSVPGGLYGQDGKTSSGPGVHCAAYLSAASTALRNGQPFPGPPSQSQLVKYAECMRANGVADFPDPTGGGFMLPGGPGSGFNRSPAFQNAAKVCVKKTGVYAPGAGGPLPPGSFLVGPPGGSGAPLVPVSGGNGGSGPNG